MTLFLKTLRERRETAAEHQADIPASEHKEDSALVAKLKAALR